MDQITNLNGFVQMVGDKLMTDSRRVAVAFGKRHSDVLRAVDRLDCGEEFSQRNYASADYIDEQGKTRRMCQLTKDGFMFLVMGFSGKQAASIKVAYINAFNGMADQLRNRDLNLWQQMHQLIALEVESKVRASFGSHLMLKRKKEKPIFESERIELENIIQPSLLLQ